METFDGRSLQKIVVDEIEYGENSVTVTTTDRLGFVLDLQMMTETMIWVGATFWLETKNYSLVTGLKTPGGYWVVRYSDQELDRRHAEQVRKSEEAHRAFVTENVGDWILRTLALDEKSRGQILDSLKDDDYVFGYMGWGYTLVIYELVDVMVKFGVESEEAEKFLSEQGMSGMQVSLAEHLAKERLASED